MVYALKVFAALLISALVGVALAAGDGIFREPFPKNPEKPSQILLEKTWAKEIEASSMEQLKPDQDMLIGTVTATKEQWPLTIVVDYAGRELRKSDIPAEKEGYFYLRLECPQKAYKRCGEDFRTSGGRDDWKLSTSGSFSRKSIKINGSTHDAHVMDGMLLTYGVSLDTPVNIYMSRVWAPKTLETHRLRLRVFGGEVSYTPPPNELATIGVLGKQSILVALIVALLGWLVRLVRPSEFVPESPPRLLGVLMCILGGVLVVVSFSDTLLFYPVTGLLFAVSGMLLSMGSRFGQWAYALMLAVAWGITFNDYGSSLGKDAVMRLGMITLLALYIFSARLSDRLGTKE